MMRPPYGPAPLPDSVMAVQIRAINLASASEMCGISSCDDQLEYIIGAQKAF